MPSIAAHMAVMKCVSEELEIESRDFIKGNLLPDIQMEDGHYRKQGKYFLVPDVHYYKSHFDLYHPLNLGYYVHLLLDYYFLEELVPINIGNLDVFEEKIMYNEYSLINGLIVQEFKLEVSILKEILSDFQENIDQEKLAYSLRCLSNLCVGKTTYLHFQEFKVFLYEIAGVIVKEIESYASKSNKLLICSRK